MISYEECYKECKCYCYDKDKKECVFKKLCVVMELPIENGDLE